MINERTEFALRSLQPGVNFSELCLEFSISRKVGYKWKNRFLKEGGAGMTDQSKRPKSSPSELTESVVCRINLLHNRHKKWGPKKIHELYRRSYGEGPSLSSFKRIFEKSGWVKKRRRRKSKESGRIGSGYKAKEPNDVWTIDFKGWWHTGDGSRCEPLTIRDEATRYLLEVRSMASAKTEAVQAVFEEVFRRYGLPKAIRSDNGAPFAAKSAVLGLSRLSAWWVALGIDLERGRPGKPQDNGGHERMHKDIRDELQCCAADDLEQQQAAFDIWRSTFNNERPHEALGMKTPAEVYENSPRKYEGTPDDIEYEGMLTRRVGQAGQIAMESRKIHISGALAGWSVGLKPLDADCYDVYFAELRIGQIELNSASFLGVASDPEERDSLRLKQPS